MLVPDNRISIDLYNRWSGFHKAIY